MHKSGILIRPNHLLVPAGVDEKAILQAICPNPNLLNRIRVVSTLPKEQNTLSKGDRTVRTDCPEDNAITSLLLRCSVARGRYFLPQEPTTKEHPMLLIGELFSAPSTCPGSTTTASQREERGFNGPVE